jgi:hypothetical protein
MSARFLGTICPIFKYKLPDQKIIGWGKGRGLHPPPIIVFRFPPVATLQQWMKKLLLSFSKLSQRMFQESSLLAVRVSIVNSVIAVYAEVQERSFHAHWTILWCLGCIFTCFPRL